MATPPDPALADSPEEGHGRHDHDQGAGQRSEKSVIPYLLPVLSLALLVTGLALEYAEVRSFTQYASLGWFLLAYLLIGWKVLRTAVVMIADGSILNEYLLMSIATVATFAIGKYPESVAVLLLYNIGVLFQEAALNRAGRSIRAVLEKKATGNQAALGGTPTRERTLVNRADRTGRSMTGDTVLADMTKLEALVQVRVTAEDAVRRTGKTQQFVTTFALFYTPLVLFMAQFLVIVPVLVVQDFVLRDWLYRAMEVVVIACPRSLMISMPLGYLGGIVAASRNSILFKGPEPLDMMRRLDTVVMDMTDALTPGAFDVQDTARAVRGMREQGVRHIVIVSGDDDAILQRLAKGLDITAAYGELSTEKKNEHLQTLKAGGAKLAFAGNGIDDASVMALADIGIAMCRPGAEATGQTADVVIQTGHPSEIATAWRISSVTHRIVWQNIWLALIAKAVLLGLAAGGLVTMWEAVLADIGIALLAIANAGRIQRMEFSAAGTLP